MRYMRAMALATVLWSLGSSASSARPGVDVVVREEVTTPSGSHGMLVRPFQAGRYPAILHLHGSDDTVADNVDILEKFARAGYVALDVEYRRTRPGYIDARDIDVSLEYLRRSRFAKPGVVGLNGFSLGGRMVLQLATRERVLAVSAIAARTSSGDTPTILDEAGRLMSPVLLQHGTEDSVVPYNDSVLLDRQLKKLGRSVELVSYPGAGHNTLPWDQVYRRVLGFFETHLR